MKKMVVTMFVLVFGSSLVYGSENGDENGGLLNLFTGPKVVETLDLQQYTGLWYEIASTKPIFQKDCECVTAEYSLTNENYVKVLNSCRKGGPDGEDSVAEGKAYPTDNPAKFNVAFGNFRLPFSNYWVVDLAPDYSYAVVSTRFRNPIWILSRTETMDPDLYAKILKSLDERDFNTSLLVPTIQDGCR